MNELRPLLSYEHALDIALQKAALKRAQRMQQKQTAILPLTACLGRVLADDLQSPVAVPYFDNSQMDGFALRAADTRGATAANPCRLPVLGAWAAGDEPAACEAGAVYEITTGAMMPAGIVDAVIKVEDVRLGHDDQSGQRWIEISQEIKSGENVRYRGGDFIEGQKIAQAGEAVGPELIMACAGLGIEQLNVCEPIRIAILATGKELQRYSDPELKQGSIRDASGPYLVALFQDPLYELVVHKLIPDDPEMFAQEIKLCLELQPDLIISTGAVSMGRHDFVRSVLEQTGAQILFHKVAVRPGKPVLFATWEQGPVLFGLPGNPISTLIGWRFFAYPYLRELLGQVREKPGTARLLHEVRKPEELTCFYKACLRQVSGETHVHILDGQGSHLISPLLKANAWAMLAAGMDTVSAAPLGLVFTFPLHAFKENVSHAEY